MKYSQDQDCPSWFRNVATRQSFPSYFPLLMLSFILLLLSQQSQPVGAVIVKRISIRADFDTVWNVLIDFDNYQDWNPWIPSMQGPSEEELEEGSNLVAKTIIAGIPLRTTHRVTVLDKAGGELCWVDTSWFVWITGGTRCRYFEEEQPQTVTTSNTTATTTNTLVTSHFVFTGLLYFLGDYLWAPLVGKGMQSENQGLKKDAESIYNE